MNEIPPKRVWTVKLEKSGDDQILRIPLEIALPGDHAVLHQDGDKVVVEAEPARSFERFLEHLRSCEPIDEEWPEIDDPPPEDVDI
jgi:antitoxin VapB